MKRFIIFTVLFSPLVLAVFLALEPSWFNTNLLPSMLKDVYLFGLVPAWVLAGVDSAVSGNRYFRLLRAALAGAAAVMMVLVVVLFGGILTTINGVLMVALLGAIPAAVCSFLSEKAISTR